MGLPARPNALGITVCGLFYRCRVYARCT